MSHIPLLREELLEFFHDLPEDVTITSIGGNCPYQVEGTIGDRLFYFRARGERWSLSIDPIDPLASKPEWQHVEGYSGEPFAASWIEDAEARRLFDIAYHAWHATAQT